MTTHAMGCEACGHRDLLDVEPRCRWCAERFAFLESEAEKVTCLGCDNREPRLVTFECGRCGTPCCDV